MTSIEQVAITTIPEFAEWLRDRIAELEDQKERNDKDYSTPFGGPVSNYTSDLTPAWGMSYWQQSTAWGHAGVVQRAGEIAMGFGCTLMVERPNNSMSVGDAIWQLKRLLSWCNTEFAEDSEVDYDKALTVSVEGLAKLLHASERHVRTMKSRHLLPKPIPLGGKIVRWSIKEIEDWIAAGTPTQEQWEKLKAKRQS